VIPSIVATVPKPSPLATVVTGGVGLVACSYANARSSAQWVL
jgi:hypothetical protein